MAALTRLLAGSAVLLATACSGDAGSDASSAPVTLNAGGSAGIAPVGSDSGGANASTGGISYASGGSSYGTAGVAAAAGGAAYGSGGAATHFGGSSNGAGGAIAPTGGSSFGSGGAIVPAGGDTGAGGSAGAPPAFDCDPSQTLTPGDHEFTIASANGLTYRYTVVVPSTVVAGKKAPLAVVWHALWSNPEETRGLTHIDATMAAHSVISVHPRSPDQAWDVGTCCTNYVLGRRRDETVFVKELLKDVESKVCVDTHRVYTAGFSNGGMLSQMLACKMADVFAAAAPMASTLTIPPGECNPSRPIPIYMINGTADPLVGYSATSLSGGLPVQQSFTTWAARDGCSGAAQTTLQAGKATCQTYSQCGAGSEVTLCSVEGMGHCMPGMKKESPMNCFTKNLILLGMPNDDIDGIDLSAEFLMRHALP
jgi:polyhydroxybutyrate depolymerase